MNNATLFIDGKPIGACKVDWHESVCESEPVSIEVNFSFSGTYRLNVKPGKQARNYKKALLRLSMSADAWQATKFYHQIHRHQSRKRQARKSA